MTTTMRFDRSLLRRYVRLQGWKGRDCVAPILFFLGLFCLQAAVGWGALIPATAALPLLFVLLHLTAMGTKRRAVRSAMEENSLPLDSRITLCCAGDGIRLRVEGAAGEKVIPYRQITRIRADKKFFYLTATTRAFLALPKGEMPDLVRSALAQRMPQAEWNSAPGWRLEPFGRFFDTVKKGRIPPAGKIRPFYSLLAAPWQHLDRAARDYSMAMVVCSGSFCWLTFGRVSFRMPSSNEACTSFGSTLSPT